MSYIIHADLHADAAACYNYGKIFLQKFAKDKNDQKVHCQCTRKYRVAAHSICNLRFNVPNEIPVVFHNKPNCDYHFIIK